MKYNKPESQKPNFNNTNVLTGISSNVIGTSYRLKHPNSKGNF